MYHTSYSNQWYLYTTDNKCWRVELPFIKQSTSVLATKSIIIFVDLTENSESRCPRLSLIFYTKKIHNTPNSNEKKTSRKRFVQFDIVKQLKNDRNQLGNKDGNKLHRPDARIFKTSIRNTLTLIFQNCGQLVRFCQS